VDLFSSFQGSSNKVEVYMIKKAYGGNASGSIFRIAIGILALIIVTAAYIGVVSAQTGDTTAMASINRWKIL
jgi:hypothetical protein